MTLMRSTFCVITIEINIFLLFYLFRVSIKIISKLIFIARFLLREGLLRTKGMPFILHPLSLYYKLFCRLKWVFELYIECILCYRQCNLFVPLNLLQRNETDIFHPMAVQQHSFHNFDITTQFFSRWKRIFLSYR